MQAMIRAPRTYLTSQDVQASLVVGLAVLGALALAGIILIQGQFEPQGGLLGVPTKISACGEVFTRSAEDEQVFTLAEVRSSGLPSPVLEPTIGEIPLLASVGRNDPACGRYLYLHVGTDAYARFVVMP